MAKRKTELTREGWDKNLKTNIMNESIIELKKLNAAYIAALEYDRCPDSDNADDVDENFQTGVSKEDLVMALDENSGRRPDEIASDMSDLIKNL